jgi:hypothetical protein
MATISPYHKPGFFAEALANGKHRDIVGGRWEETGEAQMRAMRKAGLRPHHHLLDIGAGSLRFGCMAVPYLDPGHYWATDLSGDLLRRGYALEIADKSRLPLDHLIEDADFSFPGVPDTITHALCFAVFTHLPSPFLRRGLARVRERFPNLSLFAFTVFLAPDAASLSQPFRQNDGVVTHDLKAPYHLLAQDVAHLARDTGWRLGRSEVWLPRGQVLFHARPR